MFNIERRREVEIMRKLVVELSNINNGSNFMDNLSECIEMANKLKKDDIPNNKRSFIDFIRDEAIKEKD